MNIVHTEYTVSPIPVPQLVSFSIRNLYYLSPRCPSWVLCLSFSSLSVSFVINKINSIIDHVFSTCVMCVKLDHLYQYIKICLVPVIIYQSFVYDCVHC